MTCQQRVELWLCRIADTPSPRELLKRFNLDPILLVVLSPAAWLTLREGIPAPSTRTMRPILNVRSSTYRNGPIKAAGTRSTHFRQQVVAALVCALFIFQGGHELMSPRGFPETPISN